MRERLARKLAWERRRRRGIRTLDDAYLGWLGLAVPSMLHTGSAALIDQAMRNLPTDGAVVEIGVWAGHSTLTIAHLMHLHGCGNRHIVTDPWVFEGEQALSIPGSNVSFADLRENIRDQFVRNVDFWAQRPVSAARLSSDEFFGLWANAAVVQDELGGEVRLGGPIAFCHIDGDHRLEQARRDADNTGRRLVQGGYLLLDDSDRFGGFPHLYALGCELVASGRYILAGENPHLLLRRR